MAYAFVRGVCLEMSIEEITLFREYLPNANISKLKFAWLLDKLEDDETAELFFKIIGQTIPTEKGLRDAEATFQGDDQ